MYFKFKIEFKEAKQVTPFTERGNACNSVKIL